MKQMRTIQTLLITGFVTWISLVALVFGLLSCGLAQEAGEEMVDNMQSMVTEFLSEGRARIDGMKGKLKEFEAKRMDSEKGKLSNQFGEAIANLKATLAEAGKDPSKSEFFRERLLDNLDKAADDCDCGQRGKQIVSTALEKLKEKVSRKPDSKNLGDFVDALKRLTSMKNKLDASEFSSR